MGSTGIRKEAVWQSFRRHFDEMNALHNQLKDLETRRDDLLRQIQAKIRVIEHATGLRWEQIEATSFVDTTHKKSPQKSDRITPTKEGTTRDWVLRAIAHYENDNPESRIDAGSIRIYINAKAPGFLDGRGSKSIYNALHNLKKQGLLITTITPRRGIKPQYSLTAKGHAMLL